ncbi:MAG TPA: periplasmic nitrate reductase, NapE protein [Methylomirabilota bacterium]|nr:periplasmic nitrate reductase, NapE protein [Methylomirabilota bacterium]
MDSRGELPTKRAEFITFLVLAFGVWPFVAVAVVGGYGFLVWMFQLIYGPPGPPGAAI